VRANGCVDEPDITRPYGRAKAGLYRDPQEISRFSWGASAIVRGRSRVMAAGACALHGDVATPRRSAADYFKLLARPGLVIDSGPIEV